MGEDGRGQSIWDTFSHAPGHTLNGDTGDIACRHYSRLEEDLDLIGGLGLPCYRFSVAWPRVQPEGMARPISPASISTGAWSAVCASGAPRRWPRFTTGTCPRPWRTPGGWTVRDTAERFGDYAALVGEALGNEVAMWITINEPWCAAWLGYGSGELAPGRADDGLAMLATHHLLLGHARATTALRQASAAPVGISLNLCPMVPASPHPLDVEAAAPARTAARTACTWTRC